MALSCVCNSDVLMPSLSSHKPFESESYTFFRELMCAAGRSVKRKDSDLPQC